MTEPAKIDDRPRCDGCGNPAVVFVVVVGNRGESRLCRRCWSRR